MPVFSGGIPVTFGKYYFVDANDGSDAYEGTSIARAKATVLAGYNLTTTNNHDVVLLSAATEHTVTAKLTIAKNRVHLMGLDGNAGRYYGQRSRVSLGATTSITSTVRVTGVGCTLRNIKWSNASNVGAASYVIEDGGEYTLIENCELYKSDDNDQTAAAELLGNGDSSLYRHCTFGSLATATSGAINRPCVMFDREQITGKVARDVMFEDCLFWRNAGDGGNVFIEVTAADDIERMVYFKNCTFIANPLGQTMTNVVESAATNGYLMFTGCHSINCGSWATSATNANVYVEVYCAQEEGTSDATTHQGLMVQAT
jgi:hypothetical protein